MNVRADVADAVNAAAIPGVVGVEHVPTVPVPGHTWAQFQNAEVQFIGFCYQPINTKWVVLTVLPAQTSQSTAEALDAWLPKLLEALSPLGELEGAQPRTLALAEGTTVPVLAIPLTT
jgi:hypothetical protein